MEVEPTRILILGAGFGGLYTALRLEQLLPRDGSVEVTLVNRDNFFLFTPMLHEVAASDLDITHIVSPIRALLRRTRVVCGDVIGIDFETRHVEVRHGLTQHQHVLMYDQLVLALGSITNFYNLPGLQSHSLTMKSLGDAIQIRNRLIAHLEEADAESSTEARKMLLTFVVAGGGFAGVETMAAINDFVREALGHYPSLDTSLVRMVLVHAGPELLPELGDELGAYARQKLRDRGVEIHTRVHVTDLTQNDVRLDDGSTIPSQFVVWTAGTSPHPLLATLAVPLDHGRVVVDEYLQVTGRPGLWALGDCAVVPNLQTGKPHPPTAQHAIREGRVLAENLVAMLAGRPLRPFRFSTIGQLAAIGRRTGVARVFGVKCSGFIAWWLWRTIYLMKLPGLDRKVRVALDWTLDLIFSKDIVQFVTERAPTLSHETYGSGDPGQVASGVADRARAADTLREDLPRVGAAAIQDALDDFVKMNAGTISPADFFAPANVERIVAGRAATAG
jgi:NADH dehydrogenase